MVAKGESVQSEADRAMIMASWQRCVAQHQLSRDANRPILRLQSSEILPRRQSFIDRLSGNLSEIQWLSDMSRRAGHFAVIADEECVLVMHDLAHLVGTDFERAGIVDGSCWTEQVAATNGVAMALRHRKTMTVAGGDHYYALLSRFMCTATPIFNQFDEPIGAINISALDRGDIRDKSFADHLLRIATSRIQARLFHEHFAEYVRTTISSGNPAMPENWNALIAVDSDGVIRGATRAAASEIGRENAGSLIGSKLDAVINLSIDRLASARGHDITAEAATGLLTLSPSLPKPSRLSLYARHADLNVDTGKTQRLTLADFEGGETGQSGAIKQARLLFRQGLPIHLVGETSTGKRSLAEALHFDAVMGRSPMILIDAADHGGDGSAANIAHRLEHARAFAQSRADLLPATLFLRDFDKLSESIQYQIARFLSEIEQDFDEQVTGSGLRIITATRALFGGNVLPELQSHLTGETVRLNPVGQRRDLPQIISAMQQRVDAKRRQISPNALQALATYSWPGNFRELKSVLRRASLVARGDEIGVFDLPDVVFDSQTSHDKKKVAASADDERAMICEALATTNWNMSEAARRCSISRATLHRKVKQMGIVRPSARRSALLGPIEPAT